jgi:hypothetical protein
MILEDPLTLALNDISLPGVRPTTPQIRGKRSNLEGGENVWRE